MKHKKAEKLLISYLIGELKDKERDEIELHILKCKECQEGIRELKEIIGALKRSTRIHIEEKTILRTKNLAYKVLFEKGSKEKFGTLIVPLLLLSLIIFLSSNFLFYNILSKFFKEFTPFIFYTFLGYQLSGIIVFFISLIIKLKGGLENGKIV